MRTCYFTADIRLLASRDSDEAVAEACIGAVPHLETAITLTTGDLLTLTREPAIVLKIETKRGFENLPAMLLDAMKVPRCGVMIARGDLAVECGFERLAEVQEKILWLCEAAHVPDLGDAGAREPGEGRAAFGGRNHRRWIVRRRSARCSGNCMNSDLLRRKLAAARDLQLTAGHGSV